jgi:hypothetical protein
LADGHSYAASGDRSFGLNEKTTCLVEKVAVQRLGTWFRHVPVANYLPAGRLEPALIPNHEELLSPLHHDWLGARVGDEGFGVLLLDRNRSDTREGARWQPVALVYEDGSNR